MALYRRKHEDDEEYEKRRKRVKLQRRIDYSRKYVYRRFGGGGQPLCPIPYDCVTPIDCSIALACLEICKTMCPIPYDCLTPMDCSVPTLCEEPCV